MLLLLLLLRCSGCYTMQPSLERQFCTKCGNTSLVRLISVLQADGSRRVLPEEGAHDNNTLIVVQNPTQQKREQIVEI